MERIKQLAEQLIRKYGTSDPIQLCKILGVCLLFVELPDSTEGLYYRVGGCPVILISNRLPAEAARVAAGHELGHALLHTYENYHCLPPSSQLAEHIENEADYFSACLLLYRFLSEQGEAVFTREQLACMTGIPSGVIDLWYDRAS